MTGRIQRECKPCGFGMDVPDNGLGQAIVAEFDKEHEDHQQEGEECAACSGSGVVDDDGVPGECLNCNGTGEVR
jgi:hypothetical protein